MLRLISHVTSFLHTVMNLMILCNVLLRNCRLEIHYVDRLFYTLKEFTYRGIRFVLGDFYCLMRGQNDHCDRPFHLLSHLLFTNCSIIRRYMVPALTFIYLFVLSFYLSFLLSFILLSTLRQVHELFYC
jgi:hypothetical protein